MSRNSAGTYSLPTGTHVPGTIISASTANTLEGDIAQALTDSLDRNGKGGMLAPMRTVDGTVSAPAHSFTSETGSGWFRNAAGELRLAILGTYRLAVTAATTTVNNALSVASTIFASGTITVTGALISKAITSSKLLSVKAPDTLAADYEITLPAALPGSTLPVTMTSGGVLSTAPLVNAQQNFGTPSAATDVAIKSDVDGVTTDSGTPGTNVTLTSGSISKYTNGLVVINARVGFGATTFASGATFFTLSTGYRPSHSFYTYASLHEASGSSRGLALVFINTSGQMQFQEIKKSDDWSGTELLSTANNDYVFICASYQAA